MDKNINNAKIIILAILKEIPGISPNRLQDLTQQTLFFDYFTVASAMNSLADQKLITLIEAKYEIRKDLEGRVQRSCYLTEQGEAVLAQLDEKISLPIRRQIKSFSSQELAENNLKAYYQANTNGGYDVFFEASEHGESLLELKLEVQSEARARKFTNNWPKRAKNIYSYLLSELSREDM